jgi:hypothetical protein
VGDLLFTNSGNAITLQFDAPTDRAKMVGEASCDAVLVDTSALGTGAYCVWVDSQTLVIYLGCGSTIAVGDALEIIPGSLSSADGTTTVAVGTNLTIGAPVIPVIPQPFISGTREASICNDLILDGTQSTGSGCHDMINYEWTVSSEIPNDPTLPNIQALVAAQQAKVLQISSSDLQNMFDVGRTLYFTLTTTNRFQESNSLTFPVFIQQGSAPTVSIEPSYLIVDTDSEIYLYGTALAAPESCMHSGLPVDDFDYTWVRKSGTPFQLNTDTANSRTLCIFLHQYFILSSSLHKILHQEV